MNPRRGAAAKVRADWRRFELGVRALCCLRLAMSELPWRRRRSLI